MSKFTQVARKVAVDDLDPLTLFATQTQSKEEEESLNSTAFLEGAASQPTNSGPNSSGLNAAGVSSGVEQSSPLNSVSGATRNLVVAVGRVVDNSSSAFMSSLNTWAASAASLAQSNGGGNSDAPVQFVGETSPIDGEMGRNRRQSQVSAAAAASASSVNLSQESNLLCGEFVVIDLKEAFVHISAGRLIPGVFQMTNYRFRFIPSASHIAMLTSVNPAIHSWLSVPLGCVDRIEKEKRVVKPNEASPGVNIQIFCKDIRMMRLTIHNKNNSEYETDRALSTMSAYTFPNDMKFLFAFKHFLPSQPSYFVPISPYDCVKEYSRMGVLDSVNSAWRITAVNKEYRLCKTYSKILVMPARISDEDLFHVAAFRSGHRLPVLCWGDKENGATIWRSAQPKCGVSGSCTQDERFLEYLAQSCAFKRTPLGGIRAVESLLHIVDCRPRASAMANRAAGYGYETTNYYPFTRLEFYNVPNIHVMRDSYRGLMTAVHNHSNDNYFSKYVEDTQWLTYVRLVIKASWETANFIRKGFPVLVHCSHGWDRTAQICSLAQLFLDPFYRTIDGFHILVEKEWNSFGHPFQMRCGHSQDKNSRQDDQWSPIFLQFLDCVWQLVVQFPQYFEFSPRYVLVVADHIYSARFGTFLFSSDFDRVSKEEERRRNGKFNNFKLLFFF